MLAGLILIVSSEFPVYAYVDPATGSYVLQLLIAGLVGGLYAVKTFWSNIKAGCRRLLSRQ